MSNSKENKSLQQTRELPRTPESWFGLAKQLFSTRLSRLPIMRIRKRYSPFLWTFNLWLYITSTLFIIQLQLYSIPAAMLHSWNENPPRPGPTIWTPTRPPSSWCTVGKTCPSEAREETAKAVLVHCRDTKRERCSARGNSKTRRPAEKR